jgi:hypothetical protein
MNYQIPAFLASLAIPASGVLGLDAKSFPQ